MTNPTSITGKYSITNTKDTAKVKEKIDYNFKCPANVLKNCTSDAEKDCTYKAPYCCRVQGTDYKWRKSASGTSDFNMCMFEPKKGLKKGNLSCFAIKLLICITKICDKTVFFLQVLKHSLFDGLKPIIL